MVSGKDATARLLRILKKINKANPFEVLILKGIKYKGREFAMVHSFPSIGKGVQDQSPAEG